jgi:alpha/beta superfamily hydrolase
MYNPVVSTLCRALVDAGSTVLRFNFRGTSGSTGSHGGGILEQRDVEAALDHLAALDRTDDHRHHRPGLVVAGYSFGADVGLAVDRPDIAGWIAVAPPLGVLPPGEFRAGRSPRPALILTGDRDEFCPPSLARERTADWTATEIVALADENHILGTAQHALTDHVTRFVSELDVGG